MERNITFTHLLLFPPEKVFLKKDKIVFHKGNEVREIFFKKIVKIEVRSMVVLTSNAINFLALRRKILPLELKQTKPTWLKWIYYNVNDLIITTNTGEHFNLYNLTISGTNELLSKAENFNPTLVIGEISTPFFSGCVSNGLVRIRSFTLAPNIYFLLSVLFVLFLFFLWFS